MTSGDVATKIVVTAEAVSAHALSEFLSLHVKSAEPQFVGVVVTIQIYNFLEDPFTCDSILRKFEPGSADVIYIRPRIFRYQEGLTALVYPQERCPNFFEILARLDHLLKSFLVIELEDLCFKVPETSAYVARWSGRALSENSRIRSGRGTYGRAMAALVENVRRPSIDLSPLLPLGEDQAVSDGRLATLLLRGGWYQPERDFTWSIAPFSHIHLPLPIGSNELRCTLTGFKLRSDISIAIYLDDEPVEALFFVQRDGISLRTIFSVTEARSREHVRVELRYSHTASPHSLDPMNGDLRELAFAITAIRLDRRASREPESKLWTARDILELDAEATALVTLPSHVDSAEIDDLMSAGTRVIAQDLIGSDCDGAQAADLRVGASQENLNTFLSKLVGRRRRVQVMIGAARVEDFLRVTSKLPEFARWVSVTFFVDDLGSNTQILQWMADHEYALVLEKGRALAFWQGHRDHG